MILLEPENFQFKPEMLKEMLEEAVDNYETATKFCDEVGVDRTYISKLMNTRKDTPPNPKTLLQISKNSCLEYIDLMVAAGYLPNHFMDDQPIIPSLNYAENFKKLVDGIFLVGKNRIRYEISGDKSYFVVDRYIETVEKGIESTDEGIVRKEVDIYETHEGYHIFEDAIETAKVI